MKHPGTERRDANYVQASGSTGALDGLLSKAERASRPDERLAALEPLIESMVLRSCDLGLVRGTKARASEDDRAEFLPLLEARRWQAAFPGAPAPLVLSFSAGLHQLFDFWDESHDLADAAGNAGEHKFAFYWHAIVHRREPDADNACYWFRKVDPRHEVLQALSSAYDPCAFARHCAAVKAGSAAEREALALQRRELDLLVRSQVRALMAAAPG